MTRFILGLLLSLPCASGAHSPFPKGGPFPSSSSGSVPDEAQRFSSPIYFRIGSSSIDPTFEGNGERLEAFMSRLRAVSADSNYVISRVIVAGSASPDGALDRNIELAGQRAQSLARYIADHSSVPTGRIEVINGGVNWPGLRVMIEASTDMPDKEKVLELMYLNWDDPNPTRMKTNIQYYNNSKAWYYMYEHFFPKLRTGAESTVRYKNPSQLSFENWYLLQQWIMDSSLSEEQKLALLDALANEPDAARRYALLSEVLGDEFDRWRGAMLSGLLNSASPLAGDNWMLLRTLAAADPDLPGKQDILITIDGTSATEGREAQLKEIGGGESYEYMKDHFFEELLVSKIPPTPSRYLNTDGEMVKSTLAAENWKRLRAMISASQMPGKDEVLAIIDSASTDEERLRLLKEHDSGRSYEYIKEVFFPEILYGRSATSQLNWDKFEQLVASSDLPNKDKVLSILRDMPQNEREAALRALDNGMTWNELSALLLPELLQDSESVEMTGSGMSFYYELSPRAREREEALIVRQQAEREAESRRRAEELFRKQEAERIAQEQATEYDHRRRTRPLVALKSDLVQWGGLTPNFQLGTWTPNLSAEVFFARRWSVQAGASYSNWDALGGDYKLFATLAGDLEGRYWFSEDYLFKGFYVGVYGRYGQYDVQGREGLTGNTGTFWSAGLGAGYALPLSRRWFFEMQVRGGYRSASDELYDIEAGHCFFNSKQTESGINGQVRLLLVYRFGRNK